MVFKNPVKPFKIVIALERMISDVAIASFYYLENLQISFVGGGEDDIHQTESENGKSC